MPQKKVAKKRTKTTTKKSKPKAKAEISPKSKGEPRGMREKVKQGFLTPQAAMKWLVAAAEKDGCPPSEQALKFLRNRMKREGA